MTEPTRRTPPDGSASLGRMYQEIENKLDISGALDHDSALTALGERVMMEDAAGEVISDAGRAASGHTRRVTDRKVEPASLKTDSGQPDRQGVRIRTIPRRRLHGSRSAAERRAVRRERLLDAGLELFGTTGYAAASIEKLCTHAGVSTRNFYEEFASREDLLMALYDRIIEQAFQAVLKALSDGDDAPLRKRFELAVRAFITTAASDPAWARLSYVEIIGVSNTVERHRIAWRERWAEFLVQEANRAVARGEAAPRSFQLSAVALIGSVNELMHHWSISGGQGSLDDVIAEIVRLATAAVTAP